MDTQWPLPGIVEQIRAAGRTSAFFYGWDGLRNLCTPGMLTYAFFREKLKVKVVPAKDLERYNSGQTTQVPTGRVIAVKGRVSRKMAYDGKSIKYQYVS